MGKPLIWYTLDGLRGVGTKEIIIVQGPKKDLEEELKNYKFPNLNIKYVIQKKHLGTGDAILAAEKLIRGPFFVFNAEKIDCGDYFKLILEKSKKEKSKAILLSVPTETPWLFGVIKVKGDEVLDIVEKSKKGGEPGSLRNAGAYFLPEDFLGSLKKIPAHPYSLITALLKYAKQKRLKTVKLKKETFYLKYPWNLFEVNEYLLKNIKGPAIIGKGTIIKSGAYIEGPVYIGENCQIGPNCFIKGVTNIGNNCKIGQGTEIKNSIIGDNSKIPHLNYVGDSIIGENCNLGAGVILANFRFDGKTIKTMVKGEKIDTKREKFGAVLGNNIKVGVNSSLMPGVLIGSNCIIGPHSLVMENIEDKTTYFTKFQKVIKK